MAGKIDLGLPLLIGSIGGGLSIILTVGLLSGLVGRPNSKKVLIYKQKLKLTLIPLARKN